MSSASPLTKHCPDCRALLAAETAQCACGHRFEVEGVGERPSSDLVAQAEALYESHLRARWRRAQRVARFAKIDVLRDPRNALKTTQLRAAEKEVALLETQVTIQSARAAEARAAAVRSSANSAFAQNTAGNAEPPETFRAAQSIKAEQTFELSQLQLALEKLRSTQVNGAFQNVQAERAREIARRTDAAQTCPACGNNVAAAAHCACGYTLSDPGTAAGSDFLTAEELAALRNIT